MKRNQILLVQWPSFGPYHRARLAATAAYFAEQDLSVVAMQTASKTNVYAWENESKTSFEEHLLFEDMTYQEIPGNLLKDAVYNLLETVSPAVVAVNGYSFRESKTILSWCANNRRPAILMSDSKKNDAPRNFFKELVKGRIVRKFSAYFCAGPAHRDYLIELGAPADKIVLGYDVVDNEFFRDPANATNKATLPGLDADTPFLLASSRFVPRKNIPLLICGYRDYASSVSASDQDPLRLIVLGDGEQRSEIEAIVGEDSNITLAGFRSTADIVAYYHAASAFIHPSLQDQWGLVVNEAMAAGLPVVVSETAGCAESLVKSGENGFLFDPKNRNELTEKLIEFHELDTPTRSEFGKRSIELISGYTPQTFATNIFNAFNLALEGYEPHH